MVRILIKTGMARFYVDIPKEILAKHGYPWFKDAKKLVAAKIAECVEEDDRYMLYIYFGGIPEELRQIAKECIDRMR